MIINSKALILAGICGVLGSSLGMAQTVPDHPRATKPTMPTSRSAKASMRPSTTVI